MSMSNYMENAIILHALRTGNAARPSGVWFSLHSGDPGETGANEFTAASYDRVQHGPADANFTECTVNSISNIGAITFNSGSPLSETWGTAAGWGAWDAETGGNLLWAGTMTPRSCNIGNNAPFIANGALTLTITGTILLLAKQKIFNHFFRTTAFSPVTDGAIGLHTGAPGATAGANEVSGGNYSRASYAPGDSNWDAPSDGDTANSNIITFPIPNTSDWGTVTHHSIWLNDGSLNAWFAGAVNSPQPVLSTDPAPTIPVGDLTVTVT